MTNKTLKKEATYSEKVLKLESEGLTTSDAQAVVDAAEMIAKRKAEKLTVN